MTGLLQWFAIVGLGAAAVYVLRYEPRRRPSSALPRGPIWDDAAEVGHDTMVAPDGEVIKGGRAAGT